MKEILLTAKIKVRNPVDGSQITPNIFTGKRIDEIEELELSVGNKKKKLKEFFKISGEVSETPENQTIIINGDVQSFQGIGKGMTDGLIRFEGDAGLYTGEEMAGGSIIVHGNAGSWTGACMKGGLIEVHGNAGNQIGASYRGSPHGMGGGSIIVHGSAGYEIGAWMRDGLIHVEKNAGQFAGVHMQGGTVLISGDCGGRLGAQMTGGKIALLGHIPSVLPSFTFDEKRKKVKVGEMKIEQPFYRFTGDLNENGNGKLFISVGKNPHLKFYEKFIE